MDTSETINSLNASSDLHTRSHHKPVTSGSCDLSTTNKIFSASCDVDLVPTGSHDLVTSDSHDTAAIDPIVGSHDSSSHTAPESKSNQEVLQVPSSTTLPYKDDQTPASVTTGEDDKVSYN